MVSLVQLSSMRRRVSFLFLFLFLMIPQSGLRAEDSATLDDHPKSRSATVRLSPETQVSHPEVEGLYPALEDAERLLNEDYSQFDIPDAPSPTTSQDNFEVIDYPSKYFASNPEIKKYHVLVAVDRSNHAGEKFANHKLAEIERYAAEYDVEIVVHEIPEDELHQISKAYIDIALELKKIDRDPQVANDLAGSPAGQHFARLRNYWKRIHVPATRSDIKKGIIYGIGLQGFVQFLTAHFLKGMELTTNLKTTAVVCVFGGTLNIWNPTFRKFLRSPDRQGPMLTKMTANSALFALSVGLATAANDTASFYAIYKILEHAGLSQIAKVYLQKYFSFREKYGYMSERSAYYTTQVGVFAIYLFLRLAHLYDLHIFAYGFYAMGPTGFLIYAGYKAYLAAFKRVGKRFYTVGNKEEALLVLAEADKEFDEKYLQDHPILGSPDREKYQASKLRMITRVFAYEVLEVAISGYNLGKAIVTSSKDLGVALWHRSARCFGAFGEPPLTP